MIVDFLPEANRPWYVDIWPGHAPGRGRTFLGALLDHWRKRRP